MQLFGLAITRARKKELSPPESRGSWWWPVIRESVSGAWQRNEELTADQALAFHAVFACHTLICSDISKLRVKLVALNGNVWQETRNAAYSPVLRKPNHYQNRIQFFENWVNSKLARGNAYILKRRDGRGVVVALYVLNPDRVQPLVSDDNQVFYRLAKDNLSELEADSVTVPAREIIHDRFNCLYHPLVGISPLYASALAATQGTNIQRTSTRLAANGVRPSGILVAPGRINPEDAQRLKDHWETQYSGSAGATKIAVLGDGLKFEPLTMTSEDAQLIEQLKYTAEVVCSTYHVPSYKIGIGEPPKFTNVQALNTEYYSQCLQVLIESIEVCLDEGLATGETLGTEFDIENLLRMDSTSQMDVLEKSKGKLTVNEQRAKLDKLPVEGGDTVYLQEQDHSLQWLSRRDAMPIESPAAPPSAAPEPPEMSDEDKGMIAAHALRKELRLAA